MQDISGPRFGKQIGQSGINRELSCSDTLSI